MNLLWYVQQRVHVSHELFLECRFRTCFPELPDSYPCGEDAVPSTFEEARDVCNAGTRKLKEAKEHYGLDGNVVTHTEILFDIGQLYRYEA